jgi:hypothetical protein
MASSFEDNSEKMLATLAAYGLFMLNWSLLELLLETAIAKRIELHPLEGNIVSSSLGFQARASILKSFLALDATSNAKEAIKEINIATQEANRNIIIHGHVFTDGDSSLTFVHRRVDQEFTAKRVSVDTDSMRERASRLRESVIRLQGLLSISDADLSEFANIGLIAASSPATSPSPPKSKTS